MVAMKDSKGVPRSPLFPSRRNSTPAIQHGRGMAKQKRKLCFTFNELEVTHFDVSTSQAMPCSIASYSSPRERQGLLHSSFHVATPAHAIVSDVGVGGRQGKGARVENSLPKKSAHLEPTKGAKIRGEMVILAPACCRYRQLHLQVKPIHRSHTHC